MKKNIKDQVKQILFEYPEANQSDMVLIERYCKDTIPLNCNFSRALEILERQGISFESITRARRKIQQENPELKDERMAEIRSEEEENYYVFYGGRRWTLKNKLKH